MQLNSPSGFLLFILISLFSVTASAQSSATGGNNELIYHVFQRSFYDSNNDANGDLQGLNSKLDYLQELGVTSILTLPICSSPFYHNYFSDDFEKLDPSYGVTNDWINLVKEVHRRNMKIYLDMEMQYVDEDHPWFRDSYNNPKSVYSDYLLYADSMNSKPESLFFNITQLEGYNGVVKKLVIVNLYNPQVKEYFFKVFSSWVDPNHDGKFDDGVDGFRLDHMMDDLDWKGKLTHLFDSLWQPLFSQLKKINPNLVNVAEQSDWNSYGAEYFSQSGVDRVFAFHLQQAIASFDKKKLERVADSTFSLTPQNNAQVVFIENHDMDRFSSQVKRDDGKLRVGAALNLLIGGVPAIYYGQELGMFGSGGFGKFGNSDGNDIPRREAFEWNKSDQGAGMCLWYKGSRPWWTQTNLKPNDGISLEEEKGNANSLWSFYKSLIHVRQSNAALMNGDFQVIQNGNENIFSFRRSDEKQEVFVIVNLSDVDQQTSFAIPNWTDPHRKAKLVYLFGDQSAQQSGDNISVHLPAYGVEVIQLK